MQTKAYRFLDSEVSEEFASQSYSLLEFTQTTAPSARGCAPYSGCIETQFSGAKGGMMKIVYLNNPLLDTLRCTPNIDAPVNIKLEVTELSNS